MADMSLRQTLALSVLTTPDSLARRGDAEERELWLLDLVKQSQACLPARIKQEPLLRAYLVFPYD